MTDECIRCDKEVGDLYLICTECTEDLFAESLFWIASSERIGDPVIDRYKKDSEPVLTIGERPGNELEFIPGDKTLDEVKKITEGGMDSMGKSSIYQRLNTIMAEMGVLKEVDFDRYIFSNRDIEVFSEIFYFLDGEDKKGDDELYPLLLRMANLLHYTVKKVDDSAFKPALRDELIDDFYNRAERYYERVLEFSEDDPIPLRNRGLLNLYMEDYSKSKEYFSQALEADGSDLEANLGMIKVMLQTGDIEKIEDRLNPLLDSNPEDPEVWFLKGEESRLKGRWGGAIQFYNQALSQDDNYTEAQLMKGKVLEENDMLEKADDIFDLLLDIDDWNEEAWLAKAKALYSLGKWGGSIQCLDEALTIDSQLDEAWELRGDILSDQGLYQEAVAAYENTLKINPELENVVEKKERCEESL